jgi:hypothetical protein
MPAPQRWLEIAATWRRLSTFASLLDDRQRFDLIHCFTALPNAEELTTELADLKMYLKKAESLTAMDQVLDEIVRTGAAAAVNRINKPGCFWFRGCRLGLFPEVTRMQCRAIFEAACQSG